MILYKMMTMQHNFVHYISYTIHYLALIIRVAVCVHRSKKLFTTCIL